MSVALVGYVPENSQYSPSVSMDRACELLGVSRRTIYYWIKDGRLQTRRTPMGSQRVLLDSLAMFTVQKTSVSADTVSSGN